MKKDRVFLINTQFVELYVSGFTNRFIGLWCYLEKNKQDYPDEVHWLTNRSLWHKYFNSKPKPENVTIISPDLRFFKFSSRLFYPFYILYVYYRKKCTSVHIATSIIDSIYLVRLFNLFNIPYCFTFASNSVEMAGYNNAKTKEKWEKLISLARNIEVLNPTNSITASGGRKFVSPTSFPYLVELTDIPEDIFTKKARRDTIVFCGTFVAQKNPLLAIDGFHQFLKLYSNEYPQASLVMVGRGELMKEVMTAASKVNEAFGDGCILIITDSQLVETLSTSKIFLSLQDYDNYPSQAAMEAMLFCNSVISIDNGDTKRLVDTHSGNVLLKEKNPCMLAESIKKLLDDWSLNLENREHIRTKFSPKIFAEYFFHIHQLVRGATGNLKN